MSSNRDGNKRFLHQRRPPAPGQMEEMMKHLNLNEMQHVFGGMIVEPVVEDPAPVAAKKVVKFKAGSELSNTVQ